MSHASYWLQAALYLVALHRYLKIQLEDYQIEVIWVVQPICIYVV
jgi:exodeoxyribonuclease V beta subunit